MRNVVAAALVAAVAAAGSPALGIAAESKNAARTQAPQATQVTISVTNSTGHALQGAHVNVYQTVDGKEQLVYSGVTNAQGLLTGNLPAGAFRLEVLSGAQIVGTGTLTVAPGVPAAVTMTTTVVGAVAGATGGGALGALGLGGLGPLATTAVIAAAGTLVTVGVVAAKDDASPSR